jgi:hypothetical protein
MAAIFVFTLVGSQTEVAQARTQPTTTAVRSEQQRIKNDILQTRNKVWAWQDARSPVSWEYPSIRTRGSKKYLKSDSIPYLRYVKKHWKSLAAEEWKIAKKYKDPYTAIHYVFGRYGDDAWEVAKCEGGSPVPFVYAQNGQYLGEFQMGSGERSRYGHSHTALGQAVAAYRYFVASGRDWSPWECKPW